MRYSIKHPDTFASAVAPPSSPPDWGYAGVSIELREDGAVIRMLNHTVTVTGDDVRVLRRSRA